MATDKVGRLISKSKQLNFSENVCILYFPRLNVFSLVNGVMPVEKYGVVSCYNP